MTLLFVYGTLRRGGANHAYLLGETFIGNAETRWADWEMYTLGAFPVVVAGGASAISGEVFSVGDATLARIDRLEGHPQWYCRQLVPVRLSDGRDLEAAAYIMPVYRLPPAARQVVPAAPGCVLKWVAGAE